MGCGMVGGITAAGVPPLQNRENISTPGLDGPQWQDYDASPAFALPHRPASATLHGVMLAHEQIDKAVAIHVNLQP